MDIKENKTVKSHFTCSLSSLLGFWVVLEPFQGFFDFLPLTRLLERGKAANSNGRQTHTTQLDHAYLGKIAKPWDSASAGQSWNTVLSQ